MSDTSEPGTDRLDNWFEAIADVSERWGLSNEDAEAFLEASGYSPPPHDPTVRTDGGTVEDGTDSEDTIFQQNGEVWAGDRRDLQNKLDQHYGVDGIWINGDYYREDYDEWLLDVLTYFDGDEEHFIADGVPMYGHGPSGAVGVDREFLPPEERVHEVVEEADSR